MKKTKGNKSIMKKEKNVPDAEKEQLVASILTNIFAIEGSDTAKKKDHADKGNKKKQTEKMTATTANKKNKKKNIENKKKYGKYIKKRYRSDPDQPKNLDSSEKFLRTVFNFNYIKEDGAIRFDRKYAYQFEFIETIRRYCQIDKNTVFTARVGPRGGPYKNYKAQIMLCPYGTYCKLVFRKQAYYSLTKCLEAMISHSHKRNCARSSGNPWEKFKLNDVPLNEFRKVFRRDMEEYVKIGKKLPTPLPKSAYEAFKNTFNSNNRALNQKPLPKEKFDAFVKKWNKEYDLKMMKKKKKKTGMRMMRKPVEPAIDKLLAVCGDSGSSSSSSRKKKCEFPEAPSGINRL